MKTGLSLALFLLLWVVPALADQPIALASGTSIPIVSAGAVQAPTGDRVFTVEYTTALPPDDTQARHIEADEIWNHFAKQVDQGGYVQALLKTGDYQLAFQKQNGIWRAIDFQPGEPQKITEDMARNLIARVDKTFERDELAATSLYVGDHWVQTGNLKLRGQTKTTTADRTQLDQQTSHEARNYKHTRGIYSVAIADDGRTATVESYENESGIIRGLPFALQEHSQDQMTIDGSSIVLTKSLSDITFQKSNDTAAIARPAHPLPATHRENASNFSSFGRMIGNTLVFTLFVLFMALWGFRRLHKLQILQTSGSHTTGTITDSRVYMANGGKGLYITYEFATASGQTRRGTARIIAGRVSDPGKFTNGARIPVLYSERSPSNSFPADLLEGKLASASSYSRRIWIAIAIAALLDVAAYALWRIYS